MLYIRRIINSIKEKRIRKDNEIYEAMTRMLEESANEPNCDHETDLELDSLVELGRVDGGMIRTLYQAFFGDDTDKTKRLLKYWDENSKKINTENKHTK